MISFGIKNSSLILHHLVSQFLKTPVPANPGHREKLGNNARRGVTSLWVGVLDAVRELGRLKTALSAKGNGAVASSHRMRQAEIREDPLQLQRPNSQRFCNVAWKSKFTLTCDVAKSFRIGPHNTAHKNVNHES